MFLRVTIEIFLLPPDVKVGDVSSASSQQIARSDALRAEFNAYLEEIGGFENWWDSATAEQMLDNPASRFESIDGECRYLLQGYYDDEFFHVYIDWEQGKQPRVRRIERESLRRRVK